MKISTENFTDVTLAIGDTYNDDFRSGGQCPLDMEVDKVTDEVADMMVEMGVDKVAKMVKK